MVDYSDDLSEFIATTLAAPWLSRPLSSLPGRLTKKQATQRRRLFMMAEALAKGKDKRSKTTEAAVHNAWAERAEAALASLASDFILYLSSVHNPTLLVMPEIPPTANLYDAGVADAVTALSRLARDGVPFHVLRPERAAVAFLSGARVAMHRHGLVHKYSSGAMKDTGRLLLYRAIEVAVFIGMLASRGIAVRIRQSNQDLFFRLQRSGLRIGRGMNKAMGDRLRVGAGDVVLSYLRDSLTFSVGGASFIQSGEMPQTWAALNTSGLIPQRADLVHDVARAVDISEMNSSPSKTLAAKMLFDRRLSFGIRQLGINTKHGSVHHEGDNVVWVGDDGVARPTYDRPVLEIIDRIRSMHGLLSLEAEPAPLLSPATLEALAQIREGIVPRDIAVTPASLASPVSQPEPRDSDVTSGEPDPLPPETRRIIRELEEGCRDRVEQVENGAGEAFDETVPSVGVRIGAAEDWRYSDATYRIRGMTREKLLANIRPFSELVERGRAGVAAL